MSLTEQEQDSQRSLVKLRTSRWKHNINTVRPLKSSSLDFPSLLMTELDRQLASRQLQFDSLPSLEKQRQEAWAQQQLAQQKRNIFP